MNNAEAEVIITGLISGMIFLCFTVFMVTRMFARRGDAKQGPEVLGHDSARLERIEQAVDSIAIEVERISEGQRFTSKLLADKANEQASGRLPARQVTPH